MERQIPGRRWAAQIRHFDSPVLRVRYRGGVVFNAAGLPEWDLLARAMVDLPDPEPGLTIDELRVLDVLTANTAMAAAGDPLWTASAEHDPPFTPPCWVWAHLFGTRRMALLPAEVHGAFRHLGGVATLPAEVTGYGIGVDQWTPVPTESRAELADGLLTRVESLLGSPLPSAYRVFLQATNGPTPTTPGIHPNFGFVADQPVFGLARDDRHQDLSYVQPWFRDRLTSDFLAVGYVQGGVLAVKVAGREVGSVWYYDDDDHRDDDRYDAEYVCAYLLHRCAEDFDAFLYALTAPPRRLLRRAGAAVEDGRAVLVRTEDMGASLPRAQQPPQAM